MTIPLSMTPKISRCSSWELAVEETRRRGERTGFTHQGKKGSGKKGPPDP